LIALGEEALRGVGLSGVKARYILNLSEAVAGGTVRVDQFDGWDDDAIVASLTSVKGIGVWTAEMFLIFALNRPDVLPVGDLGVRVGIRDRHGLAELPGPQQCRDLAEPWRPFRTVASWYLWRSADKTTRPATSA
jgi:DNA-3-methyladenine glycosylase II